MISKYKSPLLFALLLLALGFALGFYSSNWFKNNKALAINPNAEETRAGGYKLINPLYECSTGEQYGSEKLTEMEKSIQTYINSVIASNSTIKASVYFRDLNYGSWFGVNELEDFAPSSLLKTPVMMAYFKNAEDDPSLLSKKILFDKDPEGLIQQNFKPGSNLVKGKEYTIEELIERMISSSDNVALRLLEDNISDKEINKVTLDLGITTATPTTPNDFMDVKEYSKLFRVLYNSTYLNKKYSQKALEILSKSEFNQGIESSVPSGITISHKFGERLLPDGVNQLHDCGIVYYPNRPYLLCIMTKGPDFNDLLTTIRQISQKIYSDFHQKYPKG